MNINMTKLEQYTAYEVIRNEGKRFEGRRIEPQIIESKVVSVGKIYVTVGDGAYKRRYQEHPNETDRSRYSEKEKV